VHDYAPDETQYEWPTCVAGPTEGTGSHRLRAEELDRWACRPCEERTLKNLRELPGLFAQVNTTAALMRGARQQGAATSGSKLPPIPPRLEVLSLAATGGVATRLQAIEDAWRQTLGWTVTPWRGNPGQSMPQQIGFLTNNLGWACERYEDVGQDIKEIRHLHAECTGVLSPDPRPGRVKIGLCPVQSDTGRCGAQLTASTASHRVRCPQCRTEWPDLASWRDLRRAQETVEQDARAGVAA
jgi:hypothetical protein